MPTVHELNRIYRDAREYLVRQGVCPCLADDGDVEIFAIEQTPDAVIDELAIMLGRPVRRRTATREDVERLVENGYSASRRGESDRPHSSPPATDVRGMATEPPVIRYVSLLFREAERSRASDIHLEEAAEGLLVRFRIDGVLHTMPPPDPDLAAAVLSRLKLLAELDLAERQRPQDGRFAIRMLHSQVDIRVSVVPTLFGESIVLRVLDKGDRPSTLVDLGMSPTVEQAMRLKARLPHGLVLVTGPTGSGKTTSLYALMRERVGMAEKLITVEDPVEYQLPGVTQMPVVAQRGVTFASALRALLRQDPDVIMIGEMRDDETARVGVQAALTGHLVFATMHTNDARSARSRLVDLGVPGYLVTDTLVATLAQRLVRRTCPKCATLEEMRLAPAFLADIATPCEVPVAQGCEECRGTGYRGRIGIFELALPRLLDAPAVPAEEAMTLVDGATLVHDAWAKARAGVTSLEEVARVAAR